MYQYKLASKSDIAKICHLKDEVKQYINDINLDIWQGDYPSDDYIKEDILNGYGRIIIKDDDIVGYTTLVDIRVEYDDEFNENLMAFSRLMSKPSMHNTGIASFLISNVIAEARNRGYDGIGITVDPCNIKAINIYTKLGFKYLGPYHHQYAKNILDKYVLLFNVDKSN